jgi:hypothetical protein
MSVSIELYRVFVSTLLIVFIPQDCGDGQICSLTDNLMTQDYLYTTGLAFNFTTLGFFLILYSIEITRENKLIKYLEVNPQNPRDDESIAVIFDIIPEEYKNKIYAIDYYYQKTTYLCICLYIVNTIISGHVVYQYALGHQTITTFITNVLFMLTKVYDTYYLANTDKSIFYSAYMRDHVQFNDIDIYIKRKIEETNDIELQNMNVELEIEPDRELVSTFKTPPFVDCAFEYEYKDHEKEIQAIVSNIIDKIADDPII